MKELFVPPQGAMQFEISWCAIPWLIGQAVWINPTHRKLKFPQPRCECKVGMEVLFADGLDAETIQGGRPCVCEHMGRIIE